jgi:predicted transport protein
MSDIKLFRTTGGVVSEIQGSSVGLEKSLQNLIERNLEVSLGVRFLASEYPTGKTHAGRIDTLGLDENNSPVIIEYKRSLNQNVINQGLFYLDWLLDHRAEFTLLCMQCLGPDIQARIDWTAPRLICIAGDFTRYDTHAVSQINRNIELVRYRRYGEDFMVLELVNSSTGTAITLEEPVGPKVPTSPPRHLSERSVTEYLERAPTELRDLYQSLEDFTLALGDDVTRKALKFYIAFRRIKNFACVEVHPQARKLLAYLKVDPDSVELIPGFSRDVRKIGHFGTGDLELTLTEMADLERAKPLILSSYEAS